MELNPQAINRLLTFLNKQPDAAALLQRLSHYEDKLLAFKPKENNPKDYGIGQTSAQKILDYRNQLPGHRFSKLDQLTDIQGFGPDKLEELYKRVCRPAALTFRNSMYTNLLAENWILEYHSFHILDSEEFLEIVDNESLFTEFVCDKVEDISLQKFNNHKASLLAAQLLKCAYLETFDDPHYGAIALAFWFYQFDADNWFGFDQAREECEDYLGSYSSFDKRLELRLFKGFDNAGVLANAVTQVDLPVVVNFAEQVITLWSCQLND